MFSLPFFVWLQNLLGGGLQTVCSTGMWKAMALVLLDVNAWLQSLDSLLVERVSFVVSSPVSDPFRFAFSCLRLISAPDWWNASSRESSFPLSIPFWKGITYIVHYPLMPRFGVCVCVGVWVGGTVYRGILIHLIPRGKGVHNTDWKF